MFLNPLWVEPLLIWFDKNRRYFPWRTNPNPYTTWICEVMSQQTTLAAVLPKYRVFIERLPDVNSLATAPEEVLRELWSGLGYYARARNLQKGAQYILSSLNGNYPTTFEGWLAVPGCGPYTAAVISSISSGAVKGAVDGNVIRVVSRLLCLESDVWSPSGHAKIQTFVDAVVPEKNPGAFNEAMMELGATVCKKRQPDCNVCPVSFVCEAKKQKKIEICPPAKPQKEFSENKLYSLCFKDMRSEMNALILRKKGFLSETVGFPLLKLDDAERIFQFKNAFSDCKGILVREFETLFQHTITTHRIVGKIILVELPYSQIEKVEDFLKSCFSTNVVFWVGEDKLQRSLSTSLDMKAYTILTQSQQSLFAAHKNSTDLLAT